MTQALDTPTPSGSASRRKRRAVRVVTWVAGLVPVFAGVALWIVTRSWFLILVTAPGLEKQLGAGVRIGSASYSGNGKIICNGEDKALAEVLEQGCWTPTEFFGQDQTCQWYGRPCPL